MNFLAEAQTARGRIAPFIRKTPLEYSAQLSAETGAEVFLKLENFQVTGSFKVRGALNALSALSSEERKKGFVTASTGNHGAGLAHGAKALGIPGTIVLPNGVSEAKLAGLKLSGLELIFHGEDSGESETYARKLARERRNRYISPYNDLKVIAGQSTIGLEMTEDQPKGFDSVFVSVGGGGLISGIAGVLKSQFEKVHVVGCSPRNSCVMATSVKEGRVTNGPSLPTLSDGTAGGVDEDAVTFPFCQKLVDEWCLVSEEEIAHAMRLIFDAHSMVIEGAAGVAVASFLKSAKRCRGERVAIVLCGGRVARSVFAQTLIASESVC